MTCSVAYRRSGASAFVTRASRAADTNVCTLGALALLAEVIAHDMLAILSHSLPLSEFLGVVDREETERRGLASLSSGSLACLVRV